jgi:hypothetical protein
MEAVKKSNRENICPDNSEGEFVLGCTVNMPKLTLDAAPGFGHKSAPVSSARA